MRQYFLHVLVLLFLCLSSSAYAQERSKGFFDEGFSSKGIIEDSRDAADKMPARIPERTPPAPAPANPNANSPQAAAPAELPTATPQDAADSVLRAKRVIDQIKMQQQQLQNEAVQTGSVPRPTNQGFAITPPATTRTTSNIMDSLQKPAQNAVADGALTEKQAVDLIANKPEIAKKIPINDATKKIIGKSLQEFNQKEALEKSEARLRPANPEAGVLSLIVTLSPQNELEQHLRELARLSRDKRIPAGSVYIVTGGVTVKQLFGPQGFPINGPLISDINFLKNQPGSKFSLENVTAVPERFTVKTSPTWVVSHNGLEHVFEGTLRPASLYGSQNTFSPPGEPISKDTAGKIVYYNRFSQGTPFPAPSNLSPSEIAGISAEKKKEIVEELLGQAKALPEQKVFQTKEIPDCTESKTQRIPTPFVSGASNLDILYYSAKSRTQADLAKTWSGTAVPYKGSVSLTMNQVAKDPTAAWADALSIRCLPTRFSIEREGNERYIRYDEGDNAWKSIAAYR